MTFPELTLLARELESSDTGDQAAQKNTLERLGKLREGVRRSQAPELAICLGAVARLLEALSGSRESIGRDQVKGIACRMLYALASDLGDLPTREEEQTAVVAEDPAETPLPAPPTARIERPTKAPAPPRPQQPKRADMTFGRILVELGHVTRAQVAQALRFHRAKGPRIGECLLLQGSISPEHLLNALKIQDLLRTTPQGITPETLDRYKPREETEGAAPARAQARREPAQRVTEGIFLGEVLLGAEMITNEQLEKALHLHHLAGIRVGDALVQLGALTEEDVQGGIELQKQLRIIAGLQAA